MKAAETAVGGSGADATEEDGSGEREGVEQPFEGRPAVLAERLATRYAGDVDGQAAKWVGELLLKVATDVRGSGLCAREVALADDLRSAAGVLRQRFLASAPRKPGLGLDRVSPGTSEPR